MAAPPGPSRCQIGLWHCFFEVQRAYVGALFFSATPNLFLEAETIASRSWTARTVAPGARRVYRRLLTIRPWFWHSCEVYDTEKIQLRKTFLQFGDEC